MAGSYDRWILVAAVAGVALRVAFGALYWVEKPLTHDEREYLALARNLTEGRGFTYAGSELTGHAFGRAPGYPAFLSAIGAGRGNPAHSPLRVKIGQAVIGGFGVWLIGVIASNALGPQAGVAAAAMAAVYPPLVWIPAYVFSESLYSVMALLTALILQLAAMPRAGNPKPLLGAAAGALSGLSILVRPAMLFFVPLAAGWLILRRQHRLAVLFVVAAAAVVAPWTIRNARVHGRFVLVASEGGVTFWTGNHPLARGEGDLSSNPLLKQAELDFRRRYPGLTDDDLEPFYYQDAFHRIGERPLHWLTLLARKVFYTFVPLGPSYTLHSTRYWAVSVMSYLLLVPLAIMGLPKLWHSRWRPTSVLLLGASAVLVNVVFFPQERFRIPVIDPVLIISASPVLAAWVRR
jgi:hypothetical protein